MDGCPILLACTRDICNSETNTYPPTSSRLACRHGCSSRDRSGMVGFLALGKRITGTVHACALRANRFGIPHHRKSSLRLTFNIDPLSVRLNFDLRNGMNFPDCGSLCTYYVYVL